MHIHTYTKQNENLADQLRKLRERAVLTGESPLNSRLSDVSKLLSRRKEARPLLKIQLMDYAEM